MRILRNFFRRLRRPQQSEAIRILGELGCFNRRSNRITPSMCNYGTIKSVIAEMRRQGKDETARDLENWLRINRRKLT